MTDLPDFETVRRELETELEQEGLDTSAGPAVPVVGYEDVELLDTYSTAPVVLLSKQKTRTLKR